MGYSYINVWSVQASAATSSTYTDIGTGLTINAQQANAVCTRCGGPAVEFVQVRSLALAEFRCAWLNRMQLCFMWNHLLVSVFALAGEQW